MKKISCLFFVLTFLVSCGGDDDDNDTETSIEFDSIVDVAVANGSFTTLVTALEATGLDEVLDDESQTFTVFAPTDDAFALLGDDTINALLADTDTLSDILLYHVVSGSEIDAAGAIAAAGTTLEAANMDNLAVSLEGESVMINLSKVIIVDVEADNGVIHVIDAVLMPPTSPGTPSGTIVDTAVADDNFETLVAALTAANLVETLSDTEQTFTVFAPTDDAFAKIPTDTLNTLLAAPEGDLTTILLHHVLIGAEVDAVTAMSLNGASTESAAMLDLSIDVVDYRNASNTSDDEVAYDAESGLLVGGAGASMPGFTLYVFDDDLGDDGSTCNDGCASNWPPVLVADGSVSGVPGLGTVTRNDASVQATFQGRPVYYYAGDVEIGDTNGQGVGGIWWQVDLPATELQIGGAPVSTTDIYTSNGVIHVIDSVILP